MKIYNYFFGNYGKKSCESALICVLIMIRE
jgi:hypothetical protein